MAYADDMKEKIDGILKKENEIEIFLIRIMTLLTQMHGGVTELGFDIPDLGPRFQVALDDVEAIDHVLEEVSEQLKRWRSLL